MLFDAKEAADIDSETVFSIGINGLEELKAIEPALFDNSLFGGVTSKSLERTLLSKDVNDKLDKHISKFLQKARVPLSKTAFLQHCISDSSFLALTCDMVTEGIKLETPSSSFWTSVFSRLPPSRDPEFCFHFMHMMPSVRETFTVYPVTHLLSNLGGLKTGMSKLVSSS